MTFAISGASVQVGKSGATKGEAEEHFEPAGDKPVRLLVLYTPGGIVGFFKEIGEPA